MKIFLYLVLFFHFTGNTQSNNTIETTFDFIFGKKYFQNNIFSPSLNTMNKYELLSPLNYLGFGLTGSYVKNKKSYYDGHLEYTQIIPQKIYTTDSNQMNISGFNLGYGFLGRDLFRKSRTIDLIFSLGFNTGRLKVNALENGKYKNPYFSPMISINPRINFNKISIFGRVTYEYDISKSNWRHTNISNGPNVNLYPIKSTGLYAVVGIGVIIPD
ncbi:MAG: hypothetical protein HYR91_03535 [Flavobacteriia bacterium]|nr:hypothetical protein [Flavobacteriia bacterium]